MALARLSFSSEPFCPRKIVIPLRPYQDDAIPKVYEAIKRGKRRFVIQMPTGSGKTRLAMALVGILTDIHDYALFLAPGVALVDQTVNDALSFFPVEQVGRVQAEYNQLGCWLTIASIDTLAQKRRREQILRAHDSAHFKIIIVDEADTQITPSFKKILDDLANEDTIVIGITATPFRQDGQSLQKVFVDGLVYDVDLFDLIAMGYLCNMNTHEIRLANTLPDNLKIGGILDGKQVQEITPAMQAKLLRIDGYEKAYMAWEKLIHRERAIIYSNSVEEANEIRDYLKDRGVRIETITGKTPDDLRRNWLQALYKGELDMISNYGTLIAGYNNPRIRGIILFRHTLFSKNYNLRTLMQIIGRVLRQSDEYLPDGVSRKPYAEIVCMTTEKEHEIPVIMYSSPNLPGSLEEKETHGIRKKLLKELKQSKDERPEEWTPLEISMRINEIRVKSIHLFEGSGWTFHPDRHFTKKTPIGELICEPETLTGYSVWLVRHGEKRRLSAVGESIRAGEACKRANAYVSHQVEHLNRKGSASPPKEKKKPDVSLQLPITPEQILVLQRMPGLRQGIQRKEMQTMTQAHFYDIMAIVKQWGNKSISKEGKRIGYRQGRVYIWNGPSTQ